MKRPRRLRWKVAGLLAGALAAFLAAAAFSGSGVVKLEFVEYAKRPALKNAAVTNELSQPSEVLVAVVRISNESGTEMEITGDYPFSAPLEKDDDPAYEQRFRGYWNSDLPARLRHNGTMYQDVLMTGFDEAWIVCITCSRKDGFTKFYRSLVDCVPGIIGSQLLRLYHPGQFFYVELSPVTNLPPAELLSNTVGANLSFSRTNTPSAGR